MKCLPIIIMLLTSAGALDAEPPRVDRFGDPLPTGAIARCGTLRYRPSGAGWVAVDTSPDRRLIATGERGIVRLWERSTGKETGAIKVDGVSTHRVTFSPQGHRLLAHVGIYGYLSRPFHNRESLSLINVERRTIVRRWVYEGSRSFRFMFAQGGKRVLVLNEIGLHVHDVTTGDAIYSIAKVEDFELTSDGESILAAVDDKIEVINLETGKTIRSWETSQGRFVKVQISHDGKRLLTHTSTKQLLPVPADQTWAVWDIADGKSICCREDKFPYRVRTISPDGKIVRQCVELNDDYWDIDSDKAIEWQKSADNSRVKTATVSSGLKLTASSVETTRLAQINELGFGMVEDEPNSKLEVVQEIRAVRDGREVWRWRVSEKPRFKVDYLSVVDEKTGVDLADLPGHRHSINDLRLSANSKYLLSVDYGRNIRLWELASGRPLPTVSLPDKALRFCFLEGTKNVAAVCLDASVHVWDIESGKQTVRFSLGDDLGRQWKEAHLRYVHRLLTCDFSVDGNHLIVLSGATIEVWNVAAGKRLHQWNLGKKESIDHLSFWNNDRCILVGKSDQWYSMYSLDGKLLGEWPIAQVCVDSYSHNDSLLTIATPESLKVIDLNRFKTVNQIACEGKETLSAWCLSGDGSELATIRSKGDLIQRWDVKTGEETRRVKPRGDYRQSSPGFFTIPNGNIFARLSIDPKNSSRVLLDLSANQELYEQSWSEKCAFSNDGRILFSPNSSILMEVATGREIAKFPSTAHRGSITRVAFLPNHRQVITVGSEASIVLWDWPTAVGLMPREPANAQRMTDYWEALAKADAAAAYRAIFRFVNSPEQSVQFLRGKMKRATSEQNNRIRGWIAELDDERFRNRQNAQRLILQQGRDARGLLLEARKGRVSAETAQRIDKLLASPEIDILTAERLQELRAVQILEWIDTAKAREMLADLANGEPSALSSREAKAALARSKPKP